MIELVSSAIRHPNQMINSISICQNTFSSVYLSQKKSGREMFDWNYKIVFWRRNFLWEAAKGIPRFEDTGHSFYKMNECINHSSNYVANWWETSKHPWFFYVGRKIIDQSLLSSFLTRYITWFLKVLCHHPC